MFEPADGPRIFAQEPGADFPRCVARGLRARMAGHAPEAMARVEILLNTARMRNRLREALIEEGGGFLPRLRLITDLGADLPGAEPISPLRRRLELAQMIRKLLETEPELAPRDASFALAESLATLLDEMQGEGVAPEALEQLDVSSHADHWSRSLRFIRLVMAFLGPEGAGDPQRRQRLAVEALIERWTKAPPGHPVLIVGSTGSRGSTALLMQAVARLPQGALILPGFDFDMPGPAWAALDRPVPAEDHPQYRFRALLRDLGQTPDAVRLWAGAAAPDPARNRLVSLALRPAPVTDRWLAEGPGLGDLPAATRGLTLIEAPHPRAEALAIALRLRVALADGKKAALITPDRMLARQVTAALDRWHLRPDDSAGRPLALSAPGRFLRHCAEVLRGTHRSESLIALLKHPITHSAQDRGSHLRHVRELELWLRRRAVPFPDAAILAQWARADPERHDWATWLGEILTTSSSGDAQLLEVWVERHLSLATRLAAGVSGGDSGELWLAAAGEEARAVFDALSAEARYGGVLTVSDYFALSETILKGREVRESVAAEPGVMIWGTLEARVQGADLVILAGLNEGVWPSAAPPDPWLNRQMRLDAGLLLPERQIGLAAHDFQQAACAPEVILSRCLRDAEAETIPSRWLNRLKNLIGGLPGQHGPEALSAMRARGQVWLDHALSQDADLSTVPAAIAARNLRPAPAPPVAARPRELPVTAIKTLIRDPFHIYARHVLGLRRLDPLAPQPDARLRGTALHRVLEHYTREPHTDPERFVQLAERVLAEEVPWQASRLIWLARLQRVAADFVAWHAAEPGTPVLIESQGALDLADPVFRLIGRPDRIDRQPDGRFRLFDYKTGTPPSPREQEHFDKQLILLAIMAEEGAFSGLGPAEVEAAEFVGLGSTFRIVGADVSREALTDHRHRLRALIAAYLTPAQGFTARRALKRDIDSGDYDQLARFGEWQVSDPARTVIVGDHHE